MRYFGYIPLLYNKMSCLRLRTNILISQCGSSYYTLLRNYHLLVLFSEMKLLACAIVGADKDAWLHQSNAPRHLPRVPPFDLAHTHVNWCYLLRRYPLSRFQVLSCSFEGTLGGSLCRSARCGCTATRLMYLSRGSGWARATGVPLSTVGARCFCLGNFTR